MKTADLTAVACVPAGRVCRIKGNNVLLVCAVNSGIADIYVVVAAYGKGAAYVQISCRKQRVCCLKNACAAYGNYAVVYQRKLVCTAGVQILITRCYNVADRSHFIHV